MIFRIQQVLASEIKQELTTATVTNKLAQPIQKKFDLRYTLFTGILSYQEKALISGPGFEATELKATTIGFGIGISDWVSIGNFIFGHEFFIFEGQTDAASSSDEFSYFKRGAKTAGASLGLGFFWTPTIDKGFSVGIVSDYLYKRTSWQLSASQKIDNWSITPSALGVFIFSLEGKYQYQNLKFFHKTGFSTRLVSMIWNIGVEYSL